MASSAPLDDFIDCVGTARRSISTAKRIGLETVTYVSNIYKYYLAYQLMTHGEKTRQVAKKKVPGR